MKGFKLNFIHLCDDASFSQEGKLSIIGIFDVVHLTNIPGTLVRAYLVSNFTVLDNDLKEAKITVKVKNKKNNEEVIKTPELTVNVPGVIQPVGSKQKTLGLSLQLVNMTFKETGEYLIEVEINGEKIGEYTFFVNLVKSPKEVN